MDFSLIELAVGALAVIGLNNFIGWFMWRSFDKHLARHLDKIENKINTLNVGQVDLFAESPPDILKGIVVIHEKKKGI